MSGFLGAVAFMAMLAGAVAGMELAAFIGAVLLFPELWTQPGVPAFIRAIAERIRG
jgi:hypothetical protein